MAVMAQRKESWQKDMAKMAQKKNWQKGMAEMAQRKENWFDTSLESRSGLSFSF